MKISITRINESIPLPEYQHKQEDAGLDLFASENLVIPSGEWKLVKTGIKIAIPRGYAGFVYPRSGLALDKGVTVLNADGVIDPGYRGEIGVILINHGNEEFEVEIGDRIAQLIVQEVVQVEWQEKENLSDTTRGQGGFGHTGLKND